MKTRKKIVDTFSSTLLENFGNYCKEQNQDKKIYDFITYLLDQELILPKEVRYYAITQAFAKLKKETPLKKTEAVNYLASRFNISTRSIWSILHKQKKREEDKGLINHIDKK